jgi:hypothetical protein
MGAARLSAAVLKKSVGPALRELLQDALDLRKALVRADLVGMIEAELELPATEAELHVEDPDLRWISE